MSYFLFSLGFLFLSLAFLSLVVLIAFSAFKSARLGAPYVPMNRQVGGILFNNFILDKKGTLVDLGSGDGRILRLAARSGFKKVIGYELSWWPYLKSKFLNDRYKLDSIIEVKKENIFNADLSKADWVYLYLFPELVQKLMAKIERELKMGARVICCSFPFKRESQVLKLISQDKVKGIGVFIYEKI